MTPPRARIGVLMLLLGWMAFVFGIVPFVYGINQLKWISLTIAAVGAVVMVVGGLWLWIATRPSERSR